MTSSFEELHSNLLKLSSLVNDNGTSAEEIMVTTYWVSVFYGNIVGISQMMIGATLMILLMYTISSDATDLHVLLCTLGYHFFTAEAILCMNTSNGWSALFKLSHQVYSHCILSICGLILFITGTVMVIVTNGLSGSCHGVIGIITAVITFVTALEGILAFYSEGYFIIALISLGVLAFALSSISLCLGLLTKSFKTWAGDAVTVVLLCFISFYTLCIVSMCLAKFILNLLKSDEDSDEDTQCGEI